MLQTAYSNNLRGRLLANELPNLVQRRLDGICTMNSRLKNVIWSYSG